MDKSTKQNTREENKNEIQKLTKKFMFPPVLFFFFIYIVLFSSCVRKCVVVLCRRVSWCEAVEVVVVIHNITYTCGAYLHFDTLALMNIWSNLTTQ